MTSSRSFMTRSLNDRRDAETGLNYNYFRDYDPQVGRYIESDPIGLMGGLNTYAYVTSNPLWYFDPYGLDLTDAQIATIIYNETRSLSGPSLDVARQNIVQAILNGELRYGDRRPITAPSTATIPRQEAKTYQQCQAAVRQAKSSRASGIDPTHGAIYFNFRNSSSDAPFLGAPLSTQVGPLNNSYPSPALNASGIYANTYGGTP